MNRTEVLERLKGSGDPKAIAGMARYGITPGKAYGISIPNLRKLAKEIGMDHDLAQELWATGIHEARILASMIDDPELVTEEQMDAWARDFDAWDVCDQCCMNLFEDTELAYRKCVEWSGAEEEFVKRAGFALMARLAVSDKAPDDERFEAFLPLAEREATDDRNYVKKAISWALRQIGKRNRALNRRAISTAQEIRKIDSRSARWIASDVLRELRVERVQGHLRTRKQ